MASCLDSGQFHGRPLADLLRLNLAIPPATKPSIFGLLGGDVAGFPNGRRVSDDAVTIEVRAIAGVTIPFVDPTFKPDGALALTTSSGDPLVGQGVAPDPRKDRYLPNFPYLGVPKDGFSTPAA